MVRYETYNYLDYEEYKYLEDKTNSEMYPSSNKREFDTLLRKNIRWYLDSTIKDDEKRIELFDKFINVNMNIDVRKTEFILNQVYKLLTFLKFINYSLTEYDTERLYKKNYIINVLMENMAILNYRKPGKRLDKAFKNSNFAMLWDKILESVDLDNLRIPKEQDSYYQYLNEINYRKNLTLEEEQDLGYRILNGDKEAVNMLVKSNLKLVLQRVKKYACSKIDTLDLIQEGNMGLMEAARRFDVTKGYRFSTYASWYIEAYIKRNLYKIMNVPYHTISLILPYQSYVITYYNKYGVNPTDEEILSARNKFKELENKFDAEIKEEKEKVISAGGLKIIGTERHESRRIDNQLRGRSGRQGDPGNSKFYIGLDDDLMKIFGGNTITKVYDTLGADENMPIQSKLISNAVESAQKKVEGKNFSIRKNVLNYDDVMNTQREIIYKQRREVLDGENLKESILHMIDATAENIIDAHTIDGTVEVEESLIQELNNVLGITNQIELKENDKINASELTEKVKETAHEIYEGKEQMIGSDDLREIERVVMLKTVDEKWMDHIDAMDELKNGIGLRAYGQKDPVVQYRIEGFDMFDAMIDDIKTQVATILLHMEKTENITRTETVKITGAGLEDAAINLVDGNITEKEGGLNRTVVNKEPKVGRNDDCPCGSGKKYKNCCGR